MAGHFKLIRTTRGRYQIHLIDGGGRLVAVSVPFESKTAAVESITTTREIAGTAHVQDRTRRKDTQKRFTIAANDRRYTVRTS